MDNMRKKAGGKWKNSLCTEGAGGEWETQAIIETTEVTSSESLELTDRKQVTSIICSGTNLGTAGANGTGSIYSITLSDCFFIEKDSGICDVGGKVRARMVNLPWSTRLEERTIGGKKVLRDALASLSAKPPGWEVECEVGGILKVTDICEGATTTSAVADRANGSITAGFDDISEEEPATCSANGEKSGFILGNSFSHLRPQALWVLANALNT